MQKKEIKQTQEVSNQNNIDDSEEDDNSLDENDKEELKQISMDEFDKANKIIQRATKRRNLRLLKNVFIDRIS